MAMRFKEKKGDGKHFTDLSLVKDYKTKSVGRLPGTGSASKPDENWGALSVGNMKQEDAEQALSARAEGAWFVRHGLGNGLTISLRQGGVVTHVPVAEAAALNLDYNRRLTAQLLNLTRLDPRRQRELEALPGFFARLDRQAAERLLSTRPANAWLIRASLCSDEVAWLRKTPERVEHYAIRDDKGFQNFTDYRQRYPEPQVTG